MTRKIQSGEVFFLVIFLICISLFVTQLVFAIKSGNTPIEKDKTVQTDSVGEK